MDGWSIISGSIDLVPVRMVIRIYRSDLKGSPAPPTPARSPCPHPSLQAVHWAIDELKASVPIWKREFFEDGSQWKENEESRRLMLPPETAEAT